MSGEVLNGELIMDARKIEMVTLKKNLVYEKRPIQECSERVREGVQWERNRLTRTRATRRVQNTGAGY